MNELIVKYAYKNDCLSIDRNFSFESFYFKSNSSKLILFSWAWNSTADIVNWSIVMHFVDKETQLGMPIPRRFLFLGDSGNRGMAICHSPGIGETETYS